MYTIVRYFDNSKSYKSLARYENGVIPQMGSTMFISGYTYKVINITYDFEPVEQNEVLIDVFLEHFRWAKTRRINNDNR